MSGSYKFYKVTRQSPRAGGLSVGQAGGTHFLLIAQSCRVSLSLNEGRAAASEAGGRSEGGPEEDASPPSNYFFSRPRPKRNTMI